MTISEMKTAVKNNLGIKDDTRDILISDVILLVCDYCNLDQGNIPDILEPVIRKKAKDIIDYEAANGTGYRPEVASIKEGDGSITWSQTDGNTKASIYSLTESDKKGLRRHRGLRGYVQSVCSDV